jgi:hypothetical protein
MKAWIALAPEDSPPLPYWQTLAKTLAALCREVTDELLGFCQLIELKGRLILRLTLGVSRATLHSASARRGPALAGQSLTSILWQSVLASAP